MFDLQKYNIEEVHTFEINGIPVETGDLICTADDCPSSYFGQYWWAIGKLIPGALDHIVIYVGPGGRCVEAGAMGKVITFMVPGNKWESELMLEDRYFIDTFYGVAYPLSGRNYSSEKIKQVRLGVGQYCLTQAREEKPYNLNFLDSDTEEAFYCSQLAYKAYLPHGINLNTGKNIPEIPFTENIIYPTEVWAACLEKKLMHNRRKTFINKRVDYA